MDFNLLKVISDLGTVAILLYVLIQVLTAYKSTVDRVIGLLEHEIEDDKADVTKNA
jgi:hypothetical protein